MLKKLQEWTVNTLPPDLPFHASLWKGFKVRYTVYTLCPLPGDGFSGSGHTVNRSCPSIRYSSSLQSCPGSTRQDCGFLFLAMPSDSFSNSGNRMAREWKEKEKCSWTRNPLPVTQRLFHRQCTPLHVTHHQPQDKRMLVVGHKEAVNLYFSFASRQGKD